MIIYIIIMNNILELNEKDKLWGEIYIIKNTENNKCYVGQAVSHRKNKDKYRLFGSFGRFQDHISEAINNTKKNQCVYLNNAIRKYGKDKFICECLKKCKIDEMDNFEIKYIEKHKSLYPNGYNLTKGGKTTEHIKITNNNELNKVKKRGRDFGYTHKETTIEKMKKYYDTISEETIKKRENIMRNTMTNYYNNKRVERLVNKFEKNNVVLDENFKDHIRPYKNNDKIVNYIVRIKRVQYARLDNTQMSLEEKYNTLYDALENVYKIQQNKSKINQK